MPWTVRSYAFQGMHTVGLPCLSVRSLAVPFHTDTLACGQSAICIFRPKSNTSFFSSCTRRRSDREPFHIV